MGLKPGYKDTEIGVIPNDWNVVSIGELFSFKNGLNKAKQFFGYGTPIVNYMDVFGSPCLKVAEIKGRVYVNSKELLAYSVRKGDVFFTRTSETVDEIGIASVMLEEPENTVFSGFVLRARPVRDDLEDEYKAYCFSPHYFRSQVTARASYTTRALTNGRSLSATQLARPPKPEQRAIATALSDVDALLDGLDRLIAKKRDIKQAAMQQLLTGNTRLPGFCAGTRLSGDTRDGEEPIEGEWEVKLLGDIAHIKTGNRNNQDKVKGGAYPFFVRSKNVERINSFSHDCEAILVPGEGQIGEIFHYIIVIRIILYTLSYYLRTSPSMPLRMSNILLIRSTLPRSLPVDRGANL